MSEEQVSKTVIACESTVDINIAGDLYAHLKNALENKHVVEIDASEVQRVDTAILQVLLAYSQEAKLHGLQLCWQGVSDAFRSAACLLGLELELALPEAA